MAILGTYTKQPAESIDYDIDYSKWLPSTDDLGSTTPPEVTITPSGLTLGTVITLVADNRVKIWLSDGADKERYKVEVTVNTSEGRIRQDEFFVIVREF